MKSKGERSLQLCHAFLYFKLQLLSPPSMGKHSGSFISWRTWNPCFRTEIIRILVKTYKQKVGSNVSRCMKKDTFLPLVPGLTLISLSTSYIFFSVWTNHWLQRKTMQGKDLQGVERSRNLAPHILRKLPTWLVINSLKWQDVKMKVHK